MRKWDDLSELEQLLCIYSDAHKDAHGFRPRGESVEWTVETLREEIERLSLIVEEDIKREKEEEKAAIEAFEKEVEELLQVPGSTRSGVIKFIMGESGCYDSSDRDEQEMFLFRRGMPYNYKLGV